MTTQKKIIWLNIFSALFLGLATSVVNASENQLARVLWSEFNNKTHSIIASDYNGEQWSENTVIHTSENPITSMAMGTTKAKRTLLVWTEQIKQETQLFHKWFSSATQSWSEGELLSDFGLENIGATIVVDPSGTLNLFWAANKSGLTDIFQMTFSDDTWSKPQAIHKPNDVPDIRPSAALDLNGNVVVTWSSYSFDVGQYIERQQIIETPQHKNAQSLNENLRDTIEFTEVKVPDFLPNYAIATMHFPQNQLMQSRLIDPNN